MAYLEDILPQIRAGKKVRCLSRTKHVIVLRGKQLTYEDLGFVCPVQLTSEDILADDWELVPEPVKYKQTLYLLSNGLISYNRRGLESLIVETREIEWSVE
jgi:hypothetical protein